MGVKGLGQGRTQSKGSANDLLGFVKAQVPLLRKPSCSPQAGVGSALHRKGTQMGADLHHGHLHVQRPLRVRPPAPGSLSQRKRACRRNEVLRVAKILCFYLLNLAAPSLRQVELTHRTH